MTNLREAAQMALEALELWVPLSCKKEIAALRAALAQPEIPNNLPIANLKQDELIYPAQSEQEPFGYITPFEWETRQSETVVKVTQKAQSEHGFVYPLYTAPPQQPEQKPAAWEIYSVPPPLYPAQPQREWQGLTDEEAWEIYCDAREQKTGGWLFNARAIEAKLKAKNGY